MEKITAIRIVLFIIGSLFVLIALYLFTRKKEANKAPGWIIAAIIVFTLQSSWDWFVTTGIEFMSEYIPEFIHEIFLRKILLLRVQVKLSILTLWPIRKKRISRNPTALVGEATSKLKSANAGK